MAETTKDEQRESEENRKAEGRERESEGESDRRERQGEGGETAPEILRDGRSKKWEDRRRLEREGD